MGLSTSETEAAVKDLMGAHTRVACMGPAGEKLVQVCEHQQRRRPPGRAYRSRGRHGIQEPQGHRGARLAQGPGRRLRVAGHHTPRSGSAKPRPGDREVPHPGDDCQRSGLQPAGHSPNAELQAVHLRRRRSGQRRDSAQVAPRQECPLRQLHDRMRASPRDQRQRAPRRRQNGIRKRIRLGAFGGRR